jgi:hypothetical protein
MEPLVGHFSTSPATASTTQTHTAGHQYAVAGKRAALTNETVRGYAEAADAAMGGRVECDPGLVERVSGSR